jgi:hypothetical protein
VGRPQLLANEPRSRFGGRAAFWEVRRVRRWCAAGRGGAAQGQGRNTGGPPQRAAPGTYVGGAPLAALQRPGCVNRWELEGATERQPRILTGWCVTREIAARARFRRTTASRGKGAMTFTSSFKRATGTAPYGYQRTFAEASALPDLLEASTGAGKRLRRFLAGCGFVDLGTKNDDRTPPERVNECVGIRRGRAE